MLYFKLKPHSSGSKVLRVNLIITWFKWNTQSWATDDPVRGSVEAFFKALGLLYDDPDRAYSAAANLRSLYVRINTQLNNTVLISAAGHLTLGGMTQL